MHRKGHLPFFLLHLPKLEIKPMAHTFQAQLLFKFQCDIILVLQLSIGSYFGFLFLFEIGFNIFMPILHSCKPGLLKPFQLVISFYLRNFMQPLNGDT